MAIATRVRGVMMHVSRGIEIFGWLKSLHESRNAWNRTWTVEGNAQEDISMYLQAIGGLEYGDR